MPKDSILIVGGGLLQVPAVEAARSLGLKAIVTDGNPDAPAMSIADETHIIDIYDVPNHFALGLRLKDRIAGVFTEGADAEVTVASVAEALGLPGISIEAAMNCKNKARMRNCFDNASISPVYWYPVSGYAHNPIGYPCVVKPADNCASRGVHVVWREEDMDAAVTDAIANSTTGTALIEEYLEGPQQSVEILFNAKGNCHWLNIVDRPFDGVLELGHVNPSNLPELDRIYLFQLTEQAAQAVGVHFGAFKCDTVWTKDGPRILECTARLSGGFDCQYTTPLATGRNFIRAAMKLAVGRDDIEEDLKPTHNRYAAAWAAFPKPGRVTHIETGDVRNPFDERYIFIRVKEGDIIESYENCSQRPVFVIAVGDSYEEARDNAQRGAAALAARIVTE